MSQIEPTAASIEMLESLIKGGRLGEAIQIVTGLHPIDAARALTQLPPAMRVGVLLGIPLDTAADIVEELPDDVRARAISEMEPEEAAAILSEMDWDEEVDLLQDFDHQQAEAIIEHLEEEAPALRKLLSYDADTAGGLMNTEFIAIPVEQTARETIRSLREKASEYAEVPYTYLYAVDQEGKLVGTISFRNLVLTSANTPIAELMDERSISVDVSASAHDLVKLFKKHKYLAFPVVDDEGKLAGVVAQEDVLEHEVEEAEEELLQVSGILQGEELREMPLFARTSRRFVWLALKILLNLVTASVIALHQSTIAAFAALAVLLPVISDLGGAAGGQAAAVSIRELSLERVRPRDIFKVLFKELWVGVVNGLALGIIVGTLAWYYQHSMGTTPTGVQYGLLAATAISVNTIVAVTVGGLSPLILKRLGFDPAIAAMPILTTVTDFCGFLLVLGLAPQFIR